MMKYVGSQSLSCRQACQLPVGDSCKSKKPTLESHVAVHGTNQKFNHGGSFDKGTRQLESESWLGGTFDRGSCRQAVLIVPRQPRGAQHGIRSLCVPVAKCGFPAISDSRPTIPANCRVPISAQFTRLACLNVLPVFYMFLYTF